MNHGILNFNWAAFAVPSLAKDRVERLLASEAPVCRDEVRAFQVAYSDVHLEKNNFRFTQTLFDHDELGSCKIAIKFVIPLSILKTSERQVLHHHGVGNNTLVRIKFPEPLPPSASKITTEIIDVEGSHETEFRQAEASDCEIYFSDLKPATAWNDELSKRLE